jgi:hypothetical protein
MCAATAAHQSELYETRYHGRESSLHCEECGEYLVETPGGYLCCPRGHGKLHIEDRPEEIEPC